MTEDFGAVVDAGIQHRWADEEEVLDHLDPAWRHYLGHRGRLPGGAGMRAWLPRPRYPNPAGDDLPDAGSVAVATDPVALIERRLRPNGVERALLLGGPAMFVAANPNPYLATALVRAVNDWTIEHWLSHDELYGVALVPLQTPEAAVAELRRVGEHPKIAAVLVGAPVLGKSLGHPAYGPVYREAARLGLPVVVHRGGDGLVDVPVSPAGGHPMTFAEYDANAGLAVVTQLSSFLTNGVLDEYPELRLYLAGAGLGWLPGFAMRFELITHELRREVPWMRRSVHEYLADQVRISTYGLERGRGAEVVARMMAGGPLLSRSLVFASGFPRWDTVTVEQTCAVVPEADRAAILHDTAQDWFRWPAPVRVGH